MHGWAMGHGVFSVLYDARCLMYEEVNMVC
jgi:hypothetical protein